MYIYSLTVNAILFSAPISSFDQGLVGEPRLNYLEDLMCQWRELCQNRLLAKTELILCLHDLKLLETKLKGGIQFNKYLTQYHGPNTYGAVCNCEWLFRLPRTLEWDGTHANMFGRHKGKV